MQNNSHTCATCRFFCMEGDPENQLYFDPKSGECRFDPPSGNFTWKRTRPTHWCGKWAAPAEKQLVWKKIGAHEGGEDPVILFRRSKFCRQSGMLIAYWNERFNKFHDDGDQLVSKDEVTDWMSLPEPPKS